MRVIFMGTPDFAVPALVALVEAGHEVVAVYSQPPRAGGRRGRDLTPSPVHRAAELRWASTVRHPVSLQAVPEVQEELCGALSADIAVVAAYGLILPQADARRAAAWAVINHPWLAAAALARGGAGAARDPGG